MALKEMWRDILFSLVKKKLSDDLISVCNYLKSSAKYERLNLFPVLSSNRDINLWLGKYWLDLKKQIFTISIVQHWNMLPRETVKLPNSLLCQTKSKLTWSNKVPHEGGWTTWHTEVPSDKHFYNCVILIFHPFTSLLIQITSIRSFKAINTFKDWVKKNQWFCLVHSIQVDLCLLSTMEPLSVLFLKVINLGKTTELCTHGWKGFCNCYSIPLTIKSVFILWVFSWDGKTSGCWLQLSTYQIFHLQQVLIPGQSFCICPHKLHC